MPMPHANSLTPVQLDYRLRGSAREPVNLATDAIYDQEKIKRSKYSDICDFTYLNPKIICDTMNRILSTSLYCEVFQSDE